jgi:hypothetical protein
MQGQRENSGGPGGEGQTSELGGGREDSEVELTEQKTRAGLKARWGHQKASGGLRDRPTTVKAPEAAWDYAAGMMYTQSDPTLTIRTDVWLCYHMRKEREQGGITVPPLDSEEGRIRQRGQPVARVKNECVCVKAIRAITKGETILVPFGRIQPQQGRSTLNPHGHRSLVMGTGGFLYTSDRKWDMLLLPEETPMQLQLEKDRYRNLTPYLKYSEEAGEGNCN